MEQLATGILAETAYDGVNVGAIATNGGIVAVDAPSYPRSARDWTMQLHKLNPRPIRCTILTDYHGDRILNTRWLGAPIVAHQLTAEKLLSYDKRYPQPLLDSLTARKPENGRELSHGPVVRPAMSFSRDMHLFSGGREIVLLAAPGPTASNIWVYVPEASILFAGDTVVAETHPQLTEGNSKQWLATLERLQVWPETINTIVPGRGPLCDRSAIQPIHDYIQQMQEQVTQHYKEGRPRRETAAYVPEFLAMFPVVDLPIEWLRQQIKLSLEHVYDEVKLDQDEVGQAEETRDSDTGVKALSEA